MVAQHSSAAPQAAAETANQALDLLQQGNSQFAQKNFAAAEALFRKAVEIDPKLAGAHHALGLTLWHEGRDNEALRELTEATRLKPGSAALHLDLASAAWSLANQSQQSGGGLSPGSEITVDSYRNLAISEMAKALSIDPKDVQTHLRLAGLYLAAGKAKDAAAQARDATQLDPLNASAQVMLGRAELAHGNQVEALAEYEKAIQLNPHDGESYMAVGELQSEEQDYPEAAKAFRKAIQASPNMGAAYAALGQILEHTHQIAEARQVLKQAIALNPNDWESAYRLGRIMAGAGKAREASALFENALRVHPDFPAAREQLALGMVRRGDLAGAAAQAQTITARHPQAPEGHLVMALVLWKQRNYDASLAECAQVLSAESRPAARALAIQGLDLWQEGRHRQAQQALLAASKIRHNIGSADAFCRLIECDVRDIDVVEEFLHKSAWVLRPPPDEP